MRTYCALCQPAACQVAGSPMPHHFRACRKLARWARLAGCSTCTLRTSDRLVGCWHARPVCGRGSDVGHTSQPSFRSVESVVGDMKHACRGNLDLSADAWIAPALRDRCRSPSFGRLDTCDSCRRAECGTRVKFRTLASAVTSPRPSSTLWTPSGQKSSFSFCPLRKI